MRYTRLAIEDRSEITQLRDHFAFENFLFARALLTLESPDPPDIAHGCLDALYVELILQTDRQAVQRTDWFLVFRKVLVQGFGMLGGGVEECFVQTVGLRKLISL